MSKNTSCCDFLIMGIYDDDNDCDDKTHTKKEADQSIILSELCGFCGGKYKKTYITFTHNMKVKSCVLCNFVINFKEECIGKCFLINSNLTQNDINLKILNNFNSNGNILALSQIDPKAKIIKLSIYQFIHCYSLMSEDDKKQFNNFKIMFTNDIISYLKSGMTNYFSSSKENITILKHDNSCFENKNENYIMSNKQDQTLKKYIDQFKSKQLGIIKIIKQSIEEKQNNAVNTNKFI